MPGAEDQSPQSEIIGGGKEAHPGSLKRKKIEKCYWGGSDNPTRDRLVSEQLQFKYLDYEPIGSDPQLEYDKRRHCLPRCSVLESLEYYPDVSIFAALSESVEDLVEFFQLLTERGEELKLIDSQIESLVEIDGIEAEFDIVEEPSRLTLKNIGYETVVHGLFGGLQKKEKHRKYVINLSNVDNSFDCAINVMEQKTISAPIPKLESMKLVEEIKNCRITPCDLTVNENFCLYESNVNEIHGLIGADYAGKLFTGEIKNLPSGLVAMNTYFGCTVMGKTGEAGSANEVLLSLKEYENIFTEWVSEEIIEPVEPKELAREKGHFLPHRPILKENSTTRIRPVSKELKASAQFDLRGWKHNRPASNEENSILILSSDEFKEIVSVLGLKWNLYSDTLPCEIKEQNQYTLKDRVRHAAVFEVTGIDLCGPLFLKTDMKCWIVLAICAVYRTGHLKKVLERACLIEEFVTELCDAESLINSGPLTYLSEDSKELSALTPSMFLQEIREVGVPDPDMIDSKRLNKRCVYRLKLRQDLRNRFRNEYLLILKDYSRVKGELSIKEGDLVLIGDANNKRESTGL
ncbi:uncharacterized protein TNCV_4927761 [Trichonephila clavipes]|nr:uncharacterized protein TNCV_4927761 [Trichonephila clavipes]